MSQQRSPIVSILDLATVAPGQSVGESIGASVELAQRAEAWGFERLWFAEHHNMADIASSATAVLLAHVAANTNTIRLGSGGVMLPNHSPLVIAEQFGTLESLHPGRIDLGLGRAPGGDRATFRALRRDPAASEHFTADVLELQQLLGPAQPGQAVTAVPGVGTQVPLYILGSSLFGARLAAALGLPYAFASHFAPGDLAEAVRLYRAEFRPSAQLARPYVIAGLNVLVADSSAEAYRLYEELLARMAVRMAGRADVANIPAEVLLASPLGEQVRGMLSRVALGTASEAAKGVRKFAESAGADEVIVVTNVAETHVRLRSFELLAEGLESKS